MATHEQLHCQYENDARRELGLPPLLPSWTGGDCRLHDFVEEPWRNDYCWQSHDPCPWGLPKHALSGARIGLWIVGLLTFVAVFVVPILLGRWWGYP